LSGLLNFLKKEIMNIQAVKEEIVKMVLETENPDLLESIKELLRMEPKTDLRKTLPKDHKEVILMGIDTDEAEDFDDFIKKYGQ